MQERLPDVLAGRILRDDVAPRFKAQDYAGGIAAGVDQIIAQLDRLVPVHSVTDLADGGAHVEREVQFDFTQLRSIRLALRSPDFTTAERIESVINREFGGQVARMEDSGTVSLNIAATQINSPAHVIARLENLEVEPESRARVVVDQRSGTIVMGSDVRISRVAVAQGGLTLRIEENPLVVQPNPFAQGETMVVPRTQASIDQNPGTGLAEVTGGTTLSEVVAGLNALGVAPHDMIDILKSINAAGALHAEFLVQ